MCSKNVNFQQVVSLIDCLNICGFGINLQKSLSYIAALHYFIEVSVSGMVGKALPP